MSLVTLILAVSLAQSRLVGLPPVVEGRVQDGVPFKGGPYAGLYVGNVSLPDGRTVRGLLPSPLNASPIADYERPAVEAFIAGRMDPKSEPLASLLRGSARIAVCARQGGGCTSYKRQPTQFGEEVTPNTPYLLKRGTVRVEWLHKGVLYYLSEIRLTAGKIDFVRTQPAWLAIETDRGRH